MRRERARFTLFTIGHSTRTIEELASTLQAWGVEALVDIRQFARSRANPQFNEDTLGPALAAHGIAFGAMRALGGRRGASPDIDPRLNAAWRLDAFKNYADYAETPAFAAALEELLAQARRRPTAIMCAEILWWRCHRRIVADWAMARGVRVVHVYDASKADEAAMTPFARVVRRRRGALPIVTYPSGPARRCA
jgi:uncharacterized protein (DUF488 family)